MDDDEDEDVAPIMVERNGEGRNGNGHGDGHHHDEDEEGELEFGRSSSDNLNNINDNAVLRREYGEQEEEEVDTFLHEDNGSRGSLGHNRNGGGRENERESKSDDDSKTLVQMLSTGPAWLMLWTCVILVGGGTVMTNNIGQMTEALGFDSSLTPASLTLFSAAQAASRVATGSLSESALRWRVGCFGDGVPRPAFLVVASVIGAASHFALAVATTEEGFVTGVALSGLAFGMVWPLMVLISGEVYGNLHVGANYMFYDGASSAFGTLLLSKFVAQAVYDKHTKHSGGDGTGGDEDFTCYGKGCFQMSHLIVSALSLTCIASSIGFMCMTRDVYRRL